MLPTEDYQSAHSTSSNTNYLLYGAVALIILLFVWKRR